MNSAICGSKLDGLKRSRCYGGVPVDQLEKHAARIFRRGDDAEALSVTVEIPIRWRLSSVSWYRVETIAARQFKSLDFATETEQVIGYLR